MKYGFMDAEVVVVGGGVAGVSSSISSARNGAKTLLIERYGFPGGMFTGGNMTVLTSPPAGGIGKEIVNKLMEKGYAKKLNDDPINYGIFHYDSERCSMNVVYDAEMAKILLFNMLRESGVNLLLHTLATGAVMSNGVIKGVTVENKSGKQIIEGKVIIDATADGDIAAYAGAPYRKGQTERGLLFPMTMLVRLSHVDWVQISEYSRRDPGLEKVIKKAMDNGELPFYKSRRREMVKYWGHPAPELSRLLHDDEALLWGTVERVDGTNVDDLTRAEVEVREQFISELNFLKKYIPGFEKARIQSTGVSVGVRDTRHIIGEYTLTGKDILERRSFPDVAAYNIKAGFPANDIPYGCLVPRTIEGLLVAGNCISVVPGTTAQGPEIGSFNDLKDIPTMWTIGEAAGTAAALCVKSHGVPRKIDIKEFQGRLFEQGALLKPEIIEKLENVKLPSGIAVKEFYERILLDRREYWIKRGQVGKGNLP